MPACMELEDLPLELLFNICATLDYKSFSALSQTSRHFHKLTNDALAWQKLHEQTFSTLGIVLLRSQWRTDFVHRIRALRELLVRGTNDYHAATVREIFTKMSDATNHLFEDMLWRSEISRFDIFLEGKGFTLANAKRLTGEATLPRTLEQFLRVNQDRLQEDMRSESHLIRMLLARQSGFRMNRVNADVFLKSAHLIAYKPEQFPIYTFPEPKYNPDGYEGAIVNWGVVESLSSLVKLYRDAMGQAIPGYNRAEDDFEYDVPMCSEMFDADLSGNWKGLYGYLDFRDLAVLSPDRSVTPDYFDGVSKLKFTHEVEDPIGATPMLDGQSLLAFEDALLLNADDEDEQDDDWTQEGDNSSDANEVESGLPDAHIHDHEAQSSSYEDDSAVEEGDGEDDHNDEDDRITEEALKSILYGRRRFTAEGSSMHGRFRIQGSTMQLRGFEPGFKIVNFDAMFNGEGLMPWIMHGVHIPSIGVVGRWSDRTGLPGEGVYGPYILWRDRSQDLRDQEAAEVDYQKRRTRGEDPVKPEMCKVRHLKNATHDLAYIIIEELSKSVR